MPVLHRPALSLTNVGSTSALHRLHIGFADGSKAKGVALGTAVRTVLGSRRRLSVDAHRRQGDVHMDLCTDMCPHVCTDTCTDMCTDMCADMCMGMCLHMCIDTSNGTELVSYFQKQIEFRDIGSANTLIDSSRHALRTRASLDTSMRRRRRMCMHMSTRMPTCRRCASTETRRGSPTPFEPRRPVQPPSPCCHNYIVMASIVIAYIVMAPSAAPFALLP